MGRYTPTAITYAESGLVKDRDAFVLSDDAYQELTNIWQWRGRLRRRKGYSLLGRLQRNITNQSQTAADGTNDYNIADLMALVRVAEPQSSVVKNSLSILLDDGVDLVEFSDNGTGHFTRTIGTQWDLYAVQTITGITQAASAEITIGAHQFLVGNKVLIQNVIGMIEINDTVGTITGITATSITVNIDSTDFTLYPLGGSGQVDGSFVLYSTGEVNFTFDNATLPPSLTPPVPPAAAVVSNYGYYPNLPVMGLPSREQNDINAEQTIAFDTRYSYFFNNTAGQFQELASTTPVTWNGIDRDFFFGTNYWRTSNQEQYFWVTNFNLGSTRDPIYVYDSLSWHIFAPDLDSTGNPKLQQAKILIPYKGRMVALNTYEGNTLVGSIQYPSRARWSQNGAPFSSVAAGVLPLAPDEWRSDVKGRGGYVDAPTNEHIVSAQFIRDLLVVGFESSTWALRYSGNDILPFVWERINVELGSESTFSMVAFDKGLLFVGDKSINSCDGNGVERIDENIPDEVFNMHNTFDVSSDLSDGPKRVHGIRDFFERIVYWTFPSASSETKFPDKALVFNYHNKTWAVFTDCFTCFGEFQRFNDITWASIGGTWEATNSSWVTAKLQSQFPNIIAGNQEGFVSILNSKVDNDSSLQITDVTNNPLGVILNVKDHTLQIGEYVKVKDILGTGGLELNDRIFKIVDGDTLSDANNIVLNTKPRYSIISISSAEEAIISAPGHDFSEGQHFYIDNISTGTMVGLNGKNGYVIALTPDPDPTYPGNLLITINLSTDGLAAYVLGDGGAIQNLDANIIPATVQTRTYLGCGTLERVIGFKAISKKFNMINQGKKNFLGHIDFLTTVTAAGEISCKIFTDYNETEEVNDGSDLFYNTTFSTQAEDITQKQKIKEWHRFFAATDAQFFEYQLSLDERQLFTPAIVDSDVLIDSIIIYSESGGRLVD